MATPHIHVVLKASSHTFFCPHHELCRYLSYFTVTETQAQFLIRKMKIKILFQATCEVKIRFIEINT